MGLSKSKYNPIAKVWEVKEPSGKTVDVRISTSKKNQNGEYETDFSGYVRFCGENMVNFAKTLKEKDDIEIEAFDLTNHYDKEKKVTYYNVSVFAAKKHEWNTNGGGSNKVTGKEDFMKVPDTLEAELPFN